MSNTVELDWAQVDVFANGPLQGNMLAIFTNAHGLTDGHMQALARETNLSETTFVFPGDPQRDLDEGVLVRIFTPLEELPFAGHPTLGTAGWLRLNVAGFAAASVVKLRLRAGTIAVRFAPVEEEHAGVYGTMQQLDPTFGAFPPTDELLTALGLVKADLHPGLRPQIVSTGLPFAVVPLRDAETLNRLLWNAEAVERALEGTGSSLAYCIAPGVSSNAAGPDWHARMRFYAGEDPATGSAAGCAIAFLVRYGAVPSQTPVVLLQGEKMLRPSRITVSALLEGERVHRVEVGGRTIPVASGRFILRGF